MNYSAKDVLADYLQFSGLESSKTSWNQKTLKNNPPRFYRLKILKSLFKAFNLGNIKDFEEGGFVLKRDIEDYKTLIKQIRSDPSVKIGLRTGEKVTLKHICRTFEQSRSSLFKQPPVVFKWFATSIHTASFILGNVSQYTSSGVLLARP